MAELTLWRLTHERHADSAFSGEGARQHGGRFNRPGTTVVYTSESLALALSETLTGLDCYHQLRSYVFFRARLPEEMVFEISETDLPDLKPGALWVLLRPLSDPSLGVSFAAQVGAESPNFPDAIV